MTEEQRKKHREYMREWLKRAPHSVIMKKRLREEKWKRENAERVREYKREWQERNWSKNKQRQSSPEYKAWAKEYRQSIQGKAVKKRAKSKERGAVISNLTARQWREILDRFNHACAYCKCVKTELEQEHMLPITRGGNHDKHNVVPACRKCNLSKGLRTPEEWAHDILTAAEH